MAKFISLHYKHLIRRLHNAEHFDFFDNGIINGLQGLIATLVLVSGAFEALKIVFQREKVLFKQSQASALTPEIAAKHEKRIGVFVFFWHYVGVFRLFDDADKIPAAEKLMFLRHNYKDLPNIGYSEASGMMTNFLQDCANSEWAPLIQSLGLTFLVAQMTTDNEAFKEMYRERSIDKETIAELGKLTEVRAVVNSSFDALIDAINVSWQTNETGPQDDAVRAVLHQVKQIVVAAVRQAELTLAHRGRHKAKDEETSDAGTQTADKPQQPAPDLRKQQPAVGAAPSTPNDRPSTTEEQKGKEEPRKA